MSRPAKPVKVPLSPPYVGEEEAKSVVPVLESGWLTQGPRVAEFERLVARYLGVPHAIACSNATAALHLALLLCGVGPGDEVIVPSYTWIATANAVRMVGAMPVFADVDLDTFNVTPATVEAALTPPTKAVMPVHQFGLPADMEGIEAVARRRRLTVIEDAACALGSFYKARPVGALGNIACFSFHARKVVTTGEGGMLVVPNGEIATRARSLISHGSSTSDLAKHQADTIGGLKETFHEVGYNYRMTDLQGALGVVQMGRLEEVLARRRMRAERYTEALMRMRGVVPPRVPEFATPNWQSYVVRIEDAPPKSRDRIVAHLLGAGIACRPGYMACHLEPVYREVYPGLSLKHTEQALGEVIILPLYPRMTDEEQDYVIDTLRDALAQGPPPGGEGERLDVAPGSWG